MDVVPGLRHRNRQPAGTKSQRLVKHQDLPIDPAVLLRHVKARYTEVDAAVSHTNHDISRSLEQHRHVRQRGHSSRILAWIGLIDPQTTCRQKGLGTLSQASFAGQGQTDISSVRHTLPLE